MSRFIVETYTICQGWINCWHVDGEPMTFESIEAAQADIDELLKDWRASTGEELDPSDYRIMPDDYPEPADPFNSPWGFEG